MKAGLFELDIPMENEWLYRGSETPVHPIFIHFSLFLFAIHIIICIRVFLGNFEARIIKLAILMDNVLY